MDVMVADLPSKFGMLLSRSWASKLKVSLQMDMSYAMIHVFGTHRRLYREKNMAYMITSEDNPENLPYMLWIQIWGMQYLITTHVLKN